MGKGGGVPLDPCPSDEERGLALSVAFLLFQDRVARVSKKGGWTRGEEAQLT